jgi:hypothetical protein
MQPITIIAGTTRITIEPDIDDPCEATTDSIPKWEELRPVELQVTTAEGLFIVHAADEVGNWLSYALAHTDTYETCNVEVTLEGQPPRVYEVEEIKPEGISLQIFQHDDELFRRQTFRLTAVEE